MNVGRPVAVRVSALLVVTLAAGCSLVPSALVPRTSAPVQVEDLGAGVVRMTMRSGLLLVKSTELKARVEQEALAYCRGRTGAMAVVESSTSDPEPPAYPSASVVFRCVTP